MAGLARGRPLHHLQSVRWDCARDGVLGDERGCGCRGCGGAPQLCGSSVARPHGGGTCPDHVEARGSDRGERRAAGAARDARYRQAVCRRASRRGAGRGRVLPLLRGLLQQDRGAHPRNSAPGSYFCYTRSEPAGICGLIVPWNGPLVIGAWKLAPALAAGCSVVLKPPEQAPLSLLALGGLLAEAGLPDGVVNIVTGGGATGAGLAAHADIDRLSSPAPPPPRDVCWPLPPAISRSSRSNSGASRRPSCSRMRTSRRRLPASPAVFLATRARCASPARVST